MTHEFKFNVYALEDIQEGIEYKVSRKGKIEGTKIPKSDSPGIIKLKNLEEVAKEINRSLSKGYNSHNKIQSKMKEKILYKKINEQNIIIYQRPLNREEFMELANELSKIKK